MALTDSRHGPRGKLVTVDLRHLKPAPPRHFTGDDGLHVSLRSPPSDASYRPSLTSCLGGPGTGKLAPEAEGEDSPTAKKKPQVNWSASWTPESSSQRAHGRSKAKRRRRSPSTEWLEHGRCTLHVGSIVLTTNDPLLDLPRPFRATAEDPQLHNTPSTLAGGSGLQSVTKKPEQPDLPNETEKKETTPVIETEQRPTESQTDSTTPSNAAEERPGPKMADTGSPPWAKRMLKCRAKERARGAVSGPPAPQRPTKLAAMFR